jgi:hypothetical protein
VRGITRKLETSLFPSMPGRIPRHIRTVYSTEYKSSRRLITTVLDTAILVSVVVDLSGSVLPKALKICLCVCSVLSCLYYGVYACRLESVDFSVAS